MKTLDQIAIEHRTDKATQFTRTYAKPHGYTPHYERVFEPMRFEPIKLLEIGCGGGESMRMWLEYFPRALVHAVDIVADTNPWNTPKPKEKIPRYVFSKGDQSCTTFWACFIADFGKEWDIVIDDGSHIYSQIMTAFECLWPHVSADGLYCIEDLNEAPEAASWLGVFSKAIHAGQGDIASITFSKELAILRKRE